MPPKFVSPHKVKDNALGAVICDGKMYYAIFADSNGDTPQVRCLSRAEFGDLPNKTVS